MKLARNLGASLILAWQACSPSSRSCANSVHRKRDAVMPLTAFAPTPSGRPQYRNGRFSAQLAAIQQDIRDLACDGIATPALDVAFPHGQNPPATALECGCNPLVSINIASKFCCPEIRTRCGCGSEATIGMSVPKAAVDEDDRLEAREDQIGLSRQSFCMESVP